MVKHSKKQLEFFNKRTIIGPVYGCASLIVLTITISLIIISIFLSIIIYSK